MEVRKAFADIMEAFTEVTSTKALREAFIEIMKAFMAIMEFFVHVIEAFTEVTSTEALWKLRWKPPWKIWRT